MQTSPTPALAPPTRRWRLRTRAQFQALLAEPALARTAHFALHRQPPVAAGADAPGHAALFAPPEAAWIGALVPKRWARRAVTRNAIRRQIYAVADSLAPPLAAGAHLVRLRSAFAPRQFPSASSPALKRAVRTELQQLFAKIKA